MLRFLYTGEIRSANSESRLIEGRALSFNIESRVLCELGRYFSETLAPGCITEDVLNSSNIILNYNHDRSEVLARSNKRVGTLNLELREDGLYFSAELPKTQLADEVLELVRRGDLQECSFAFYPDEDTIEWDRNEDTNVLHRTVNNILELSDIAIVVDAAYGLNDATYVLARNAELLFAEKNLIDTKDMKKQKRAVEDPKDEEIKDPKETVENTENQDDSSDAEMDDAENTTEERADENDDENAAEAKETSDNQDDSSDDENDDAENAAETENRNINIKKQHKNNNIIMKKNITLVQLIRSAIDKNERKFNLSLETRTMSVNNKNTDGSADPYAVGDAVVEEEYQSIVEPLYNNLVFGGLGIHMYTGAPKGDYNFPVLGKGTVGFAKEVAAAVASGNTITNVHLSPKRITGYVDISKQLLLQDTLGINEAIRRDLYNAIADAIQNAMLDDTAKDDTRPAGLLNGITNSGTITNFKGLTDLEADLEDVNFENVQYLVSNKAYSALRNLAKSAKTTELVLENGTIDGTKVTRTGALSGNTIVLADFSLVVMAIWSDAEVVVDEVSQAVNGCVRLVISAYIDWSWVREGAVKVASI